MKNSKYTIGNRTHYLPVCSAVPQPTAPLFAPFFQVQYVIYYILGYKKECIISTQRLQLYLLFKRLVDGIQLGLHSVKNSSINVVKITDLMPDSLYLGNNLRYGFITVNKFESKNIRHMQDISV